MRRFSFPCALAVVLAGCTTTRPMLASPLGRDAPATYLVAGVRVFDGVSEALSGPVDVVLAGGRIASIEPAGAAAAPEGAQRIEAAGKTLLPGLVDAHVHLGGPDGMPPWDAQLPNVDAQAAALLFSGVTSVVAASRETDIAAVDRAVLSGKLAGPRLVRATRLFTAVDGHPAPLARAMISWPISALYITTTMRQVGSVEAARRLVAEEIEQTHPDYVKVIYDDLPVGTAHLSFEELRAIVEEARAHGLPTYVHVASPQDAMEAVEAGAALLMHVPWDGLLTDEQAKAIAARVPVVTTRRIWSVIDDALKGGLSLHPLEQAVLPQAAASFAALPAGYQVPGYSPEYLAQLPGYDRMLGENLMKLRAAGARLVAGTDSGLPAMLHGPALHRELQALVALGIPAAEALRMATSVPARLFKLGYSGVVRRGATADLLLVDGDPLQDVSATERIVEVFKGGRRVERLAPGP